MENKYSLHHTETTLTHELSILHKHLFRSGSLWLLQSFWQPGPLNIISEWRLTPGLPWASAVLPAVTEPLQSKIHPLQELLSQCYVPSTPPPLILQDWVAGYFTMTIADLSLTFIPSLGPDLPVPNPGRVGASP